MALIYLTTQRCVCATDLGCRRGHRGSDHPLRRLWALKPTRPKPMRMAVPGSGTGVQTAHVSKAVVEKSNVGVVTSVLSSAKSAAAPAALLRA